VIEKNTVYIEVSKIVDLKNNNFKLTELQEKRYKAFSVKKRAVEYKTIYSCLNEKLSLFLGCPISDLEFNTTDLGKPYLEGNPLCFNIAHSGEVVVFAYSLDPIGIDIETNRFIKNEQKLLEKVLSDDDLFHTKGDPFFHTWTKVESFVKCLGLSLFNINKKSLFEKSPILYQGKSYFQRVITSITDCTIALTKEGVISRVVNL
jgi:phosphopantetheinyl transferase